MGTKKKYKAEEIILKLREADVELGQVTSGAKGKGRGRGGKLSLKVFLHLVQDVRPLFRSRNFGSPPKYGSPPKAGAGPAPDQQQHALTRSL